MLLSTMYHEGGPIGSHVTQAPSNWASSTRPEAEAVNELQAYRAERSISERLGLDPVEIGVIDSNVSSKLSIIRGTPYESRVAKGNYTLFDSDLITR